ncbi:unnamed protein product [Closterium sp. Naga37s-1]|nr:unnamed protein product [Closterium sp. Naga37s-1]
MKSSLRIPCLSSSKLLGTYLPPTLSSLLPPPLRPSVLPALAPCSHPPAPGPPPLTCNGEPPPVDVAQPAWTESVVHTPAYAADTLPQRQAPLRRSVLGYGGSTSAARWRIWGCHAGELPGENAQLIRTRLYFDTVVVRKRSGGDGRSWAGGSGGVERGGGERGELADGVAEEGKRRVASQSQDGTKGTDGVDIFFQGEFGYECTGSDEEE